MELNKAVKEELSGSNAKSFVARISGYNRVQGSTMFHEAAEYVKNELVKMGFEDAKIERYIADGNNSYWTHLSPVGWSVKSAELRLEEPEPSMLICTYEDIPHSLHTYSNATPREGILAELADVGSGTKAKDYVGKNVKDKFVLATGRARVVHEQAVYKRGAAGVITDSVTYEMPNVRESLDIPDAHAYQAIWPAAEDLSKVKFGFSLSKRQGNQLRALLDKGKTVKLRAKVDAKLFSFYEDVVTATIQGDSKSEEEIFLVTHLCHPKPSANDNASGSGLLLEIARAIRALMKKGRIEYPSRTIRFLWVPETLGTTAFLQKHEKEARSNFVAGINLDMVGQNQELCHSTLNVDRTPDSLPSYLSDFVYSLVEESVQEFDSPTPFGSSSTFRYRIMPFTGGSDHVEFTEATIGVPCVMLLQWPDLFYHTSLDTIDKVSEDSLRRIGWITTMAALTLASASHEDIFRLVQLTCAKGISRLCDAGTEAVSRLLKIHSDVRFNRKRNELAMELAKTADYYRSKIQHIVWREQEAVKSVRRLGQHPELLNFVEKYSEDIIQNGKREIQRFQDAIDYIVKESALKLPSNMGTQADAEALKLLPKRSFKGSLSSDFFKKALGEKEYEWYEEITEKDKDFSRKMAEILNFMDGKRNLRDIIIAVSGEYTPTQTEYAVKYVKDLEKTGLVSFK